jgi:hypothetical protein
MTRVLLPDCLFEKIFIRIIILLLIWFNKVSREDDELFQQLALPGVWATVGENWKGV